jgi:hypothetical protein
MDSVTLHIQGNIWVGRDNTTGKLRTFVASPLQSTPLPEQLQGGIHSFRPIPHNDLPVNTELEGLRVTNLMPGRFHFKAEATVTPEFNPSTFDWEHKYRIRVISLEPIKK